MKLFKNILVLLAIAIPTIVNAQITIKGKVTDGTTGETLPFVTISFPGSTAGTNTDVDGNYILKTTAPKDSLTASYIGYRTVKMKVNKNAAVQVINFVLPTNEYALAEVVIKPGKNPAIILLEKIIDHKPENDRDRYDAYQYETYNKLEFDINNIGDKFKKSGMVKPFDFAFNFIDSTNKDEKPYLPLFLTESLSDFYYKKKPTFKKEIIKGSKTAGFQNESVSAVLGDMYQNVNVYDNNILVFGKNFVSPISGSGTFFYKYYLVDSMFIENHWTYQVKFVPKRKQELTFNGNFWVHDTTFALKRIEMKIAEGANINFINSFSVVQEFKRVDNKYWMLSKDRLTVDFTYKNKAMGVYGRKTTTYKDIILNQPKEDNFYSKTNDLIVEEGASLKDDKFWAENRHDTLSKNEANVYKLVDTIQQVPLYKTYESIVQLAFTGYHMFDRWNKLEFGPVFSSVSYNAVEGYRLRIGGRTSYNFSHKKEINLYGAYGFLDKKLKFGLTYKWKPKNTKRWEFLTVRAQDDYEILGQNNMLLRQDNLFVSLFRKRPLTQLTRVQQLRATYDYEVFKGFLVRPGVNFRNIIPVGSTIFAYSDTVTWPYATTNHKKYLRTAELTFFGRFAYKEKYIEGDFTRVFLGTKIPILQVQYNAGIKGLAGSQYNYHKVITNIIDRVRLQPLGYTDYTLEYGKIFGSPLPYILLELHPGNESYGLSYYSFNLMNYFEFVSDNYYSFSFDHHFDGFFFNKVPLLRKLKLREVVNFKGVAGTLSPVHLAELTLPANTHQLSFTKPYMEFSAGMENILKFFRVDAIFRLNYLDKTIYKDITPFGIKATAQIIF